MPMNIARKPEAPRRATSVPLDYAEAIAEERAAQWKQDNAAALDAWNNWVAENNLPLAKYRLF